MIDVGGAGLIPTPGLIWQGIARYLLSNYESSRPSIVVSPLVVLYLDETHQGWNYTLDNSHIGIYVSEGACPVDEAGDTKIIVDEIVVASKRTRESSHNVYASTVPIYISCSAR